MADWKRCSTKESRKSAGNGQGRLWLISRYEGNDSCGHVDANDCPDGYKLPGNNTVNQSKNDDDQISIWHVQHTGGDCIDGGDWYHARPMSTGAIATASGGYPNFWRNVSGTHTTFDSNDPGCCGDDDFAKVCYKDTDGWKRTNPENGNRRVDAGNWEYHKNICCGFNKDKRSVTSDRYCDYSYCWEPASGSGGHHSRFDKISSSCQTQLETLCTKWGTGSIIGFEDDRCAWNRRQIVDKDKNVSEAGVAEIQRAAVLTAQISQNSYKNNGKTLCTADVFANKGTSGSTARKKFDKCSIWCQDNLEECGSNIKTACQQIYNRYKSNPDAYSNLIEDNDDICACNWPDEFYQNIKNEWKEKYNASDSQVSGKRACIYQPCNDAAIKPADRSERITKPCDPRNFISCIQNIEADFSGSTVTGDTDIIVEAQQECGTIADTGAASGSGDGGEEGEEVEGDGNNNTIIIIVVIIIMLLIAAAVIIL